MNKNALTLKIAESFVAADIMSGMTFGAEMIANVCFDTPLSPRSVDQINKIIRREGHLAEQMHMIRDIYGEEEIDSTGHPASPSKPFSMDDIPTGVPLSREEIVKRIYGGADEYSEEAALQRMAARRAAYPSRYAEEPTDRRAAKAVEGHEAMDDIMDEVDRHLFGDGTYTERVERPKGSKTSEEIENELLKSTLLNQAIIALHTLNALFDDTDFDGLVEEMIESLTEKRDSLIED